MQRALEAARSFCSLLPYAVSHVVTVTAQADHSVQTLLGTYAHMLAECHPIAPAQRRPAAEQIAAART